MNLFLDTGHPISNGHTTGGWKANRRSHAPDLLIGGQALKLGRTVKRLAMAQDLLLAPTL